MTHVEKVSLFEVEGVRRGVSPPQDVLPLLDENIS